jgi:parvulin-like peptidyl-prolyl isomerase
MDNKRNIFIYLTACIVVLVGIICFMFIKINTTKRLLNESVLATSDYGDITVKDVKTYLKNLETFFKKSFDFNELSKEEMQIIIKEVVNERIILKKAKNTNITSDKKYIEKLNIISNNLLKEMFLEELINKNITDKTINDKYEELVKFLENKKEYKVKHILVKTEEEIKKVVSELKNNTFEKLAEKYYIDASKENGGDLGYVVEGKIIKEFEDNIKNQPLNRMTKPFATVYGWHIAIKEDERKAVVPTFEDSKDSIRANLITEFIKKYSQDNLNESNIQFK